MKTTRYWACRALLQRARCTQELPNNGKVKGLGYITLFIGTHDVLIADCRKLERQAREEHVKIGYHDYEGLMHVWMLFSFPESIEALKQTIETITMSDRGNRELQFRRYPSFLSDHRSNSSSRNARLTNSELFSSTSDH